LAHELAMIPKFWTIFIDNRKLLLAFCFEVCERSPQRTRVSELIT
jgi:hypothetical protein